MKYDAEQIGKLIKLEREKLGWSQEKLGLKLYISGKQISLYEKGSLPPLNNLLNLCEIFECELGYLLGEETYANGTKLNTQISDLLGLSNDTITKLQHFTSPNSRFHFRYEYESFRRIINSFICSDNFETLLEALHSLDHCYKSMGAFDTRLTNSFDKETLDKAFEVYCGPDDYAHDTTLPPLPVEVNKAYNMIDSINNEQYNLSYSIKVARYELNEAFLILINEMYRTESNTK